MKSLFATADFEEVQERALALKDASRGLWGKMSAGQMLWHCQIPLKLAIENKKHHTKGKLLARWLFKKLMYNDTPWRKNLPTVPMARAKEEKDFIKERQRLLELLKAFYDLRDRKEWNPHPVFGHFTAAQWGQMQYKHLDHHLRQFGV